MMDQDGVFVVQICHIEAAETGGERFHASMSNESRRSIKNLMLICGSICLIDRSCPAFVCSSPSVAVRVWGFKGRHRATDARYIRGPERKPTGSRGWCGRAVRGAKSSFYFGPTHGGRLQQSLGVNQIPVAQSRLREAILVTADERCVIFFAMSSVANRVMVASPSGDLRDIVEVELGAGIYVVDVEGEFPRVVVEWSALHPDPCTDQPLLVPLGVMENSPPSYFVVLGIR
jgi:hypothetical protein